MGRAAYVYLVRPLAFLPRHTSYIHIMGLNMIVAAARGKYLLDRVGRNSTKWGYSTGRGTVLAELVVEHANKQTCAAAAVIASNNRWPTSCGDGQCVTSTLTEMDAESCHFDA